MLRSIEAFIAASLVIGAILFPTIGIKKSELLSELKIKQDVFNILKTLDNIGSLRRYALENNATAIENEIEKIGNPFYKYKVVIYNQTTNLTDASLTKQQRIMSISYFLAGDYGNFAIREVRVYIWKIS
jgi:hypothetical protein